MPRFLAVDYVKDAVKKHQTLLNRLLLTLPAHLECIESYPHCVIAETLYRTPWKRVSNKDKILEFDQADIADDIKELCCQPDSIQTCESFSSFELLVEEEDEDDDLEIVPSSNPDSPLPTNHQLQEIKQQLKQQQLLLQDELEVFAKEDLSPSINALEKGDELCLEEPIADDDIRECRNLPKLEQLCERLPVQSVCDPLLDKDGKPFQENQLARLSDDLPEDDVTPGESGEIFLKTNIHETQVGLLDDDLMAENTTVCGLETEGIPSVHKLQEMFELGQEDIGKDVPHHEQEMIKSCDKSMDQTDQLCKMSPEAELNSKIEDFIVLNGQGLEESVEARDRVKSVMLESPMGDDNNVTHSLSEMITTLEPCQLSPDNTQIILSSDDKKTEENIIWQREKRLSDVTGLTFLEPSLAEDTSDTQTTVTGNAIEKLDLQTDKIGSDVELQLPWDPLSASSKTILHHRNVFDKFLSDRDECRETQDIETYDKYSSVFILCEDEDRLQEVGSEIVEMSVTTDTLMQKASTLGCGDIDAQPAVREYGIQQEKSVNQQMSRQLQKSESTREETKIDPCQQVNTDPLSNFMMLRLGNVQTPPPQMSKKKESPEGKSARAVLKTPEMRQCLDKQESPCSSTIASTAKKVNHKKDKSKVVIVKMSDDFHKMVSYIEIACSDPIRELRDQNAISTSYVFSSLTPDVTRFLLKQQEKLIDGENYQDRKRENYKNVLLLHTLVSVADVMIHCSLSSAISYINTVEDKHEDLLTGSLESIQRQLFKQQFIFHERNTVHPKLRELSHQIREWYCRKMQKSDGDQDPKILVIIKRDFSGLAPIIVKTLQTLKGITTGLVEAEKMPCVSYDEITQALDHHNCVVIDSHSIGEDFPWSHFALVVEYEHQQQSPWQQLCIRQNIRHIALQSVPIECLVARPTQSDAISQPSRQETKSVREQYTVIASHKLTSNTDLLHLLEARYDIAIIERNYENLRHFYQLNFNQLRALHFADVIVDERTCIILQELPELATEGSGLPLINQVIALSMKYTLCWLVLHIHTVHKSQYRYPFSGHVTSNVALLNASVAQFSNKTDGFEVKIVYSQSTLETAKLIREICEDTLTRTCVWDKEDWITRNWLTQEISNHERFLLSFPCVNSFCAQVMLTASPLQTLISSSLPQLINLCPWIPQKVLKEFHRTLHYRGNTGSSPDYQTPIEMMYSQDSLNEDCNVLEISSRDEVLADPIERDDQRYLVDSDDYLPSQTRKHQQILDGECYPHGGNDRWPFEPEGKPEFQEDCDDWIKQHRFKFSPQNAPIGYGLSTGSEPQHSYGQSGQYGHGEPNTKYSQISNLEYSDQPSQYASRHPRGVKLQCVPPTPRSQKPVSVRARTPIRAVSLGNDEDFDTSRWQYKVPHVGVAQPFLHTTDGCGSNFDGMMANKLWPGDYTTRKTPVGSTIDKPDQAVPNSHHSTLHGECAEDLSLFAPEHSLRTLTPTKRRRLVYEKVPGMKGQTKLSFF